MIDKLLNALDHLPDYLWNLMLIAGAILVGLIIKWLLAITIKFLYAKKGEYSLTRSIIKHLGKPVNYFLPLLALNLAEPLIRIKPKYFPAYDKFVDISLIIAFAAILVSITNVVQDYIYHVYDSSAENNLRARKIRTQLQFVRRLVITTIIILTVCAVLLNFDHLRKIGATLLTGVGVGGIIIGFAAQKSLGNFLAGFQIAFTQPIRIDDVLVLEGEWGRVEEISLTYVVVNIWDQRRLIVPINYFIEKPFQNWTRSTSELLGTVFLYMDYTIPLEPLRAEFYRLLDGAPLWDKRVRVLQITNASEKTMEIRFLMSAHNSSQAFDLRCYIRENLIVYIQQNYPGSLPQNRVTLDNPFTGQVPAVVTERS
ncbi:mechanosensitive ion channel family protein [Deminuibacter soli]|uniref:Mechanosensitive ion channel family protein n=2 Tax=Deminuibacter soli TaxID=2291815 RepID=A0A3E1NMU9_9BACT|nr:mechanosensitive ion channel family protein [Deminuibacter soli]